MPECRKTQLIYYWGRKSLTKGKEVYSLGGKSKVFRKILNFVNSSFIIMIIPMILFVNT